MTTIISSNLVLSSEVKAQGNAGVIGYQNVLNVSNVTVTSALATNPITSVANPATAYTWKSAAADAPNVVSYPGLTNAMPSPFDPSGWYGSTTDPDGTITNVTLANSSGQSYMGLAERTTSGPLNMTGFPTVPTVIGDNLAGAMLIRKANSLGEAFRFRIADTQGFLADITISATDGSYVAGGLTYQVRNIGADMLIEFKYTTIRDSGAGVYCQSFIWTNGNTGSAPTGAQLYVQAAFFGKSDEYPAFVRDSGIIVTTQTAGQQIDYIGIARHNLDQVGLTITVKFNGITVIPASSVSSIQAILFLLNEATPDTVEIIIKGATVAPQIGVIYIGKALRLERNIYVGHTPILYNRDRTSFNGVSENGQYLGEVVVRQSNSTSVNLQNLTPNWYRTGLDPFFALSPRVPCFYAWRPEGYPLEVGYCWIEGKPNMSNQLSNGMVQCSFNMRGIV